MPRKLDHELEAEEADTPLSLEELAVIAGVEDGREPYDAKTVANWVAPGILGTTLTLVSFRGRQLTSRAIFRRFRAGVADKLAAAGFPLLGKELLDAKAVDDEQAVGRLKALALQADPLGEDQLVSFAYLADQVVNRWTGATYTIEELTSWADAGKNGVVLKSFRLGQTPMTALGLLRQFQDEVDRGPDQPSVLEAELHAPSLPAIVAQSGGGLADTPVLGPGTEVLFSSSSPTDAAVGRGVVFDVVGDLVWIRTVYGSEVIRPTHRVRAAEVEPVSPPVAPVPDKPDESEPVPEWPQDPDAPINLRMLGKLAAMEAGREAPYGLQTVRAWADPKQGRLGVVLQTFKRLGETVTTRRLWEKFQEELAPALRALTERRRQNMNRVLAGEFSKRAKDPAQAHPNGVANAK